MTRTTKRTRTSTKKVWSKSLFFEGFAKPENERSISTAASFRNANLRPSTVRVLTFLTRHLSNFSSSLNSTSGTSMIVPYETITKSIPMSSATSLRNTSIKNTRMSESLYSIPALRSLILTLFQKVSVRTRRFMNR